MKKTLTAIFVLILSFYFSNIVNAETVSLQLISENSSGTIGDDASYEPKFSDDGNFIVFYSAATNLVSGDTNGRADAFVYNISTGEIELVSKSNGGTLANSDVDNADISEDGRYVVFDTSATNLVPGDTNAIKDVFMYDRNLDTIERISVDSSENEVTASTTGSTDPAVSDNGVYVSFSSNATNLVAGDTNDTFDIFVRNVSAGTTERISVSSSEVEGNGASYNTSAISEDGRYVAFVSAATNLVSGDTNGVTDVFVRDRTLGTTERVSVSTGGAQSNGTSSIVQITFDGRFVTFASAATNLVSGDTNGVYDAFVHDRISNSTRRINVDENNTEDNADAAWSSISSDGLYSTFYSESSIFDGADGSGHVFYTEITDEDGTSAAIEKASPNSGDVDQNSYLDSIEDNVTTFVNSVSSGYYTVKTTGDCVRNSSISTLEENSLAAKDKGYDYPSGIVDFSVTCDNSGESATVTLYCFCDNLSTGELSARKYNENTQTYSDVNATITETTIDGNKVIKMVYVVTDGEDLDEDGLENGTIVDPIGFAVPDYGIIGQVSGGGGSSKKKETKEIESIVKEDEISCSPLTTLMKINSKQGEVSKLQQTLNTLGFNTGPVDGWFGNLTNSGVKAFQASQNIDADGIVGPITRSRLNKFCK